jgi:uncharacterized delta-60 repeat protein
MNLIKILQIPLLVIVCAVISIACSNGKSPVEPSSDEISGISNDLPVSLGSATDSRSLLAVYDAVIDQAGKTFMITPSDHITPSDRSAQYHFPLTRMYPNVLKITGYGFTPNLWADIKLVHPFPGSGIDAFDPRVIAILPANPGVRFVYPVLGVGGNNAVVLEPDGYTKLFDSLGGSIPGNVNPFKAYFKDQPNRVWSGTGVTEETQRWRMDIAGFGGPLQFKIVVDVSTNYPDLPEPRIDNAREPVEIDMTIGPGLTTIGGSAEINVTLLDWQGQSGISDVQIEAPNLFNSTISLAYSAPGPNPNEYVYTGTITNSLRAPEGEHKILIAASDINTSMGIFCEFLVYVNNADENGNLIWAKRAGGAKDDNGFGITSLSDNSTVVTGLFEGVSTFGPGEPNETILTSAGDSDIFVARYNPDGSLAWVKQAGWFDGGGSGSAITSLSDNSIVVTGYFYGSAAFDSNETNKTNFTVLSSAGYEDIFIARYNPEGTLVWAKRAGGAKGDFGNGITTLSDDSTVVTGYIEGKATFGPGEPNETVLVGDEDIFIARYNPDGSLLWAKKIGDDFQDKGFAITALSDNSIVVTGTFSGSVTFGPGEPDETVLTGNRDIFIARYNPDGTLLWAKGAGASDYDCGAGITTLSDDSIVVTGWFENTVTFGEGDPNQTVLTSAGEYDIFIARYNPIGTLKWVRSAGGIGWEQGLGITSLSNNSIVITGMYGYTATFGLGEVNQTILASVIDSEDVFVARYNPNGMLTWAKSAGGMNRDFGAGITALSDNSTVVTGEFDSYDVRFGPGEPYQTDLIAIGREEMFVARFKP